MIMCHARALNCAIRKLTASLLYIIFVNRAFLVMGLLLPAVNISIPLALKPDPPHLLSCDLMAEAPDPSARVIQSDISVWVGDAHRESDGSNIRPPIFQLYSLLS